MASAHCTASGKQLFSASSDENQNDVYIDKYNNRKQWSTNYKF